MDEIVVAVDELLTIIETIAKNSANNDKSLLELIKIVINRTIALERKVEMLMDLHHVDKDGEPTIRH